MIPVDTVDATKCLAYPEIKENAGVTKSSHYKFASTQGSH